MTSNGCRCKDGKIIVYEKMKTIVYKSNRMGFIRRCIQFAIILGLVIFVLLDKKRPYKFYELSSSLVTKTKGCGLVNRPNSQRIVWDIVDSVVPPQEENGIFITTNVIRTDNQTQGVCPEDSKVSTCITDCDCRENETLYLGNGVMTGRCVQATSHIKSCAIKSWCPIENDTMEDTATPMIKGVLNYTIFIKNAVFFDKVNEQRSNLVDCTSKEIPPNCNYNASDDLLKCCPIFKVSTIFNYANITEPTELLINGGVIQIVITWNCNFIWSKNDCTLKYTFSRLFKIPNKFYSGTNFRYANYYINNGIEYRTLFKVFGLRILIEVRGKAKKFDPLIIFLSTVALFKCLESVTIFCNLMSRLLANQKKNRSTQTEVYKKLKKNDNRLFDKKNAINSNKCQLITNCFTKTENLLDLFCEYYYTSYVNIDSGNCSVPIKKRIKRRNKSTQTEQNIESENNSSTQNYRDNESIYNSTQYYQALYETESLINETEI